MAERLEDLLRACTVRVLGGPMPGAGFFVAPNVVVTCVHVIGDDEGLVVRSEHDELPAVEAPVTRRVAVLADRGRPIPVLERDYPDVAVLEVGSVGAHPCVMVDLDWPSQDDSFQTFGYPREGGGVGLTPARLTYRGTHGTHPAAYLDLASDTVKPGMSGGAVLNLRSHAVCGVVVASKHITQPDGALAVPWSSVADDLAEVLRANRAFHASDGRWADAARAHREVLRFRLPRPDVYFTGRDELLRQLEEALSVDRAGVIIETISGLGGVGKSRLAAAFVEAHRDDFEVVAWVRAEDGGIADLADLAVALALPVSGRTPAQRAGDVLVFLSNTERSWLLVFDNVPGPQALRDLPHSGPGRVLVTSRHRGGYEPFGVELVVDVFDHDTAVSYLINRSGRSDEHSAASAVATALGELPLALAHAGAYCAQGTGVSFGDYLELLEGLPARELFDTNQEVFYESTVAATWNTSMSAAESDAPAARAALDMTAYLAADAIPRSFFTVLMDPSAIGKKRVHDALAALHRYSLATVTDSHLTVHRLVQKVIKGQMDGPAAAIAVGHAITALVDAAGGDPTLPAAWPQWQRLIPHLEVLANTPHLDDIEAGRLVGVLNSACAFLLESGSPRAMDLAGRTLDLAVMFLGNDHPDTLTARTWFAFSNRAAGRTAEAVPILEQVVADYSRLRGPDHLNTVGARGNLALAYQSAGRTAKAIEIEEQVVVDQHRLLGPDHPDTLTARHNLASSYRLAGRAAEAVPLLELAVADYTRLIGPDHPHTVTARANLAGSYQQAGRTAEAIDIEKEVVADYDRVLGPDHPHTLAARANLAGSYQEAGRTAESIPIFEQVVADYERVLGPGHPDTVNARANLTGSYQQAGRTAESSPIFEQVVADLERVLGPDHPDTVNARVSLAGSYQQAGRTADAIPLLQQGVADLERVLGPDHPNTLTTRANLAGSYQQGGRTAESIPIFEQVVADLERVLGPDHPDTVNARVSLAGSYQQAGRTAKAIPILEQAVADLERVLSPDHPNTLTALANLAGSYQEAGRAAEAVPILEQVVVGRERCLAPDHADTIAARNNLASSLWEAGRAAEAVPLLEQVVADRERLLGSDHPETLNARDNLAVTYESAGRTAEAIAIEEQVAADRERLFGPDHPDTLNTRANLAHAYLSSGRTSEAVPLLEQVVADRERLLGPDHPVTLNTRANLKSMKESHGTRSDGEHVEEPIADPAKE